MDNRDNWSTAAYAGSLTRYGCFPRSPAPPLSTRVCPIIGPSSLMGLSCQWPRRTPRARVALPFHPSRAELRAGQCFCSPLLRPGRIPGPLPSHHHPGSGENHEGSSQQPCLGGPAEVRRCFEVVVREGNSRLDGLPKRAGSWPMVGVARQEKEERDADGRVAQNLR